jgi:hypothetical protein
MVLKGQLLIVQGARNVFMSGQRTWNHRVKQLTLKAGKISLKIRARLTEKGELLCHAFPDNTTIVFFIPLPKTNGSHAMVSKTGRNKAGGKFASWSGTFIIDTSAR